MKKNMKRMVIVLLSAVMLIGSLFIAVPTFATDASGNAIGADVSNHNGHIDWAAAKQSGLEFAIIRIGWGNDQYNQDDPDAEYNMQQCEKLGIPYGVYIYSYAISSAEVNSEISHTLRMIKGHNPTLGIWFDMEDADTYKLRHNFNPYTHGADLTSFCLQFMRGMKENGYYNVGVYANPDYFKNVLNYNAIRNEGMIWLAHWGVDAPSSSFPCELWQYTADGRMGGFSGYLDMNRIFPSSVLYSKVVKTTIPTDYVRQGDSEVILFGDVSGDNKIDVIDLAAIKLALLNKTNLVGDAKTCADVNHDGKVDVIDLAAVKLHLLGKRDLIKEQEEAAKLEETQNTPLENETEEAEIPEQTEAQGSEEAEK